MDLSPLSMPLDGSDTPPLIYLATPYYHERDHAKRWRVEAARRMTRMLFEHGCYVFCPIAYGSAWRGNFDRPHEWWMKLDTNILRRCDTLAVAMFPGWEKSHGVEEEIILATALNKPIFYIAWTKELETKLGMFPWPW
jgi:Domain of unknown function (DUF1937)